MVEIKIKRLGEDMTSAQIKRKRISILDKIANLQDQLTDLQSKCNHQNVTKKLQGSTGNYDPTADYYWIDWHCPDCNKRWTTDQSRENILKPGIRIQ